MQNLTPLLIEWSSAFTRLALHDFNHFARTSGISLTQMNVLLHLHYLEPQDMNSFGSYMQMSPAAASQMIDRLVKEDYIQRAETTGDRRVRQISLTAKGRLIVQECLSAQELWIGRLTEDFTPEEIRLVTDALTILKRHTADMQIHP